MMGGIGGGDKDGWQTKSASLKAVVESIAQGGGLQDANAYVALKDATALFDQRKFEEAFRLAGLAFACCSAGPSAEEMDGVAAK